MPIPEIGRQVGEVRVAAAYQAKPEDTLIVCDATSAGFTVTLYRDAHSGAYHRLVVKIADDDVSGNSVTITDGTFSTAITSTSAAVELETDYEGKWLAVATFPTVDAATAISAADSAGLISSTAESASISNVDATSAAQSGVDLNTATISINKSIAASATLSGTSASQSIAASATTSGVSKAESTATSQNTAQSVVISLNRSEAASAASSAAAA